MTCPRCALALPVGDVIVWRYRISGDKQHPAKRTVEIEIISCEHRDAGGAVDTGRQDGVRT